MDLGMVASDLKSEIKRLTAILNLIEGQSVQQASVSIGFPVTAVKRGRPAGIKSVPMKRRPMSEEGKQNIREALRRRIAERNGETVAPAKKTAAKKAGKRAYNKRAKPDTAGV
jgi:uncharacterized protein (UPF0262 family)